MNTNARLHADLYKYMNTYAVYARILGILILMHLKCPRNICATAASDPFIYVKNNTMQY